MRIAFYESHRDPAPTSIDASWAELAELLSEVERTECTAGPLWHVVRHADRTDIYSGKDCPAKYCRAWSPVAIEGSRKSEHVRHVTIAVFDLDHLDDAALLHVAERIEGFEYLIHSTHNPRCYRLVMPLSRDVPAAEWRTFLRTAVKELDIPADPACKDLSRLYFLPTVPAGRDALVELGHGVVLDVDALLALASERGETTHVVPDDDPLEDAVDVGDLRGVLASVRRRKAGSTNPADVERYALLGRILKGEPLAQPGARDNTVNQAASLLAFVLPASTPTEAVQELLRPSLAAMNTEPEGMDHWLGRVELNARNAQRRRLERDAKREQDNETIRARMRGMGARARTPATTSATVEVHEGEEVPSAESEEDRTWQSDLIMRADGTPKACGYNAALILAKAPRMVQWSFRWNLVTKNIEVTGGPFFGMDQEVLPIAVCDWLQRDHGIGLSVSEVAQRILRVAHQNRYDPLADYLNGLTWDGTKRVDDFLLYYCAARTTNERGEDITGHLQTVGRKWLISAIARALSPGCQVDTVLVLEGDQGIRKTSLFRVLGGPYYCDTQITLGEKDSKMLTASNWIVELAELASLNRSETRAQKAFLSGMTDKYRPPYGRALVDAPRRCVFVGTINPEDGGYLVDRTGNRRWWPVWCGAELWERNADLRRDRDQIFAEAVQLYRSGEEWWLTEKEQSVADGEADDRLGDDAVEAKIADWWYALHPDKREACVQTHTIAENVLRLDFAQVSRMRGLTMTIGVALRRLGFSRRRRMVAGRQAYEYVATERLLKAPQGGRGSHLQLIANARVKP